MRIPILKENNMTNTCNNKAKDTPSGHYLSGVTDSKNS